MDYTNENATKTLDVRYKDWLNRFRIPDIIRRSDLYYKEKIDMIKSLMRFLMEEPDDFVNLYEKLFNEQSFLFAALLDFGLDENKTQTSTIPEVPGGNGR